MAGILTAGLLVPLLFGESLGSGGTSSVSAGGGAASVGPTEGGDGGPTEGPATTAGPTETAGPTGSGGRADTAVGGPQAGAAGPVGGGDTAGVPGAATGLAATDIGVSRDRIKIGVAILDLGGVNSVGINVPSVDPQLQMRAWDAYIKATNDSGGIGGRRIEHVFRQYDVLRPEDMRAACLYFTQEQRVFAVMDAGGFDGGAVLCVTEENLTPLIMLGSQGMPRDWYVRSDGRLFTMFPSGIRTMSNLAWELQAAGVPKKTAKIGILGDERSDPGGHTVDDGMIRTLKDLGYTVAHRSRLSSDLNTAASQVPLEVNEMQTKQVDHVLLLTGTVNGQGFVQTADRQGYTPRYFATDWASAYSDTYGANMPDSFVGNLLFTTVRNNDWRVGNPVAPYDAECLRRYEELSGEKVDPSTIAYSVVLRICTNHDLFVKSATNAGPELTRVALSGAMQNLGEVPLATFFAGYYAPGRFDAASHLRTAEWRNDCPTSEETTSPKCWLPKSPFRPTHF